MWEKFKKSAFAEKCRAFSKNKNAVIVSVCLLLATAVIISVTVATNRAKKKYSDEETPTNQVTDDPSGTTGGTIDTPTYNNPDDSEVNGGGEELTISLPVNGVLSKNHDASVQVWSDTMGEYRVHLGIDISSELDTPVCAVADGKVAKIWDDALMGRCVAIEHDGDVVTIYKNLSQTMADGIQTGVQVKGGQKIGLVGETAISELADEPHVHLEMTVGGLAVNPLDYMSKESKDILKIDSFTESGTRNPENVTNGK